MRTARSAGAEESAGVRRTKQYIAEHWQRTAHKASRQRKPAGGGKAAGSRQWQAIQQIHKTRQAAAGSKPRKAAGGAAVRVCYR